MIKHCALTALAGLALVTATAASAAPVELGRSTTVSYADLNLASAEGRATLQRRLRHAVNVVCSIDDPSNLALLRARDACRRYAQGTADRGVQEAMLRRGAGTQLAINDVSGR